MGTPLRPACKSSTTPNSKVLIEVGIPRKFPLGTGKALYSLKRSCKVGKGFLKPVCTMVKGQLTKMEYRIGDLDGDGVKDYFVLEKNKYGWTLYARSGKRRHCISGWISTNRLSTLKVKKGAKGSINIIFAEQKIALVGPRRVGGYNPFAHERTLVLGARKYLAGKYPKSFKDNKGKAYTSRYPRDLIKDSTGKNVFALMGSPWPMASFPFTRSSIAKVSR